MSQPLGADALNTYVRAHYASDKESTHGIGRVVSYSTEPTFDIERADGTRFSWLASLCEPYEKPDQRLLDARVVEDRDGQLWGRGSGGTWWQVCGRFGGYDLEHLEREHGPLTPWARADEGPHRSPLARAISRWTKEELAEIKRQLRCPTSEGAGE